MLPPPKVTFRYTKKKNVLFQRSKPFEISKQKHSIIKKYSDELQKPLIQHRQKEFSTAFSTLEESIVHLPRFSDCQNNFFKKKNKILISL
jgi:hypothetical protein